jgi:hypothetical protein
MRKPVHLAILSLCVSAPWNAAFAQSLSSSPPALTARVVAVGIPGVAAVAPVGRFHAGGPIHDKPEFAAFTQPGRVLDPNRVLVTSTSNFGAPMALRGRSFLSIPTGRPWQFPPRSPQPATKPSL